MAGGQCFLAWFIFLETEYKVKKEVMDWFFKLAVFGTLIAFVAILLPWVGVDMGRLSSGGDIAGGLASAFGLAVAAIAIRLYVWSESPEKRKLDAVVDRIESIKTKMHLMGIMSTQIIESTTNGFSPETKVRAEKVIVDTAYSIATEDLDSDLCAYLLTTGVKSDIAVRFKAAAILCFEVQSDPVAGKTFSRSGQSDVARLMSLAEPDFLAWVAAQNREVVRKNMGL